jgi:hypothetical protein
VRRRKRLRLLKIKSYRQRKKEDGEYYTRTKNRRC